MMKFVFVSGIMRTLFPKSASRNGESKECSKQEAGTIPAKWLVAFARAEEDQRCLESSLLVRCYWFELRARAYFSVQQGGCGVKTPAAQIFAGGDHARLRLRLQGLSETI